jgi:hypothetical protein
MSLTFIPPPPYSTITITLLGLSGISWEVGYEWWSSILLILWSTQLLASFMILEGSHILNRFTILSVSYWPQPSLKGIHIIISEKLCNWVTTLSISSSICFAFASGFFTCFDFTKSWGKVLLNKKSHSIGRVIPTIRFYF